MIFFIYFFNKTPFFAAVENENSEIVDLLLTYGKVDVNFVCILKLTFFFSYNYNYIFFNQNTGPVFQGILK